MGLERKLVLIDFHSPILRGTVSTGGFKGVMEIAKDHILEGMVTCKFAALVPLDATAVNVTVLCQKLPNNHHWRFF